MCLDLNADSGPLLGMGDVDTLGLERLIRSKVTEGVRRAHSEAPAYLLDCGHNFGDAVYWCDLESGYVLLPDDFMRLVVFEMSDWATPVYAAITPDAPKYPRQRSKFKGIRGTWEKPVCAIAIRPEGKALEFYSCKSQNAQVSKAVYLPYPDIDRHGGVEISRRCYQGAVYAIASLVSLSLGEAEKSTALSEAAKTALT